MIPERVDGKKVSLRGYRLNDTECASLLRLIKANQQTLEDTGVLSNRLDSTDVLDFLYCYHYQKGIIKDKIVYAVEDNQTHQQIGEIGGIRCGFKPTLFLAYWIDSAYRKMGYTSEAFTLFEKMVYQNLPEIKSLMANTYYDNVASKSFLKKNGFAALKDCPFMPSVFEKVRD